ncbi:MAG: hypothetical protein GY757_52630, partial [bacterium]|nr:hypothetical protein [bacterium]
MHITISRRSNYAKKNITTAFAFVTIFLVLVTPLLCEETIRLPNKFYQLLNSWQYKKAGIFCKYQRGKIKDECYRVLAERRYGSRIRPYIETRQYRNAESVYRKPKGRLKYECYRILVDACLKNKDFDKALHYCKKYQYAGGYNQLGSYCLEQKQFEDAAQWFQKGTHSLLKAKGFRNLGDHFGKTNPEMAVQCYKNAIASYEYMLKSVFFDWDAQYSSGWFHCKKQLELFDLSPEDIALQKKMDLVLEKAAVYCSKLKSNVFHFFCDERIAEYTGLSVDRLSGQQRDFHYVYNYQLIQDKNGIKETRKLFGGRQSNLQSKSVRNEKLVFGPITLLHKEAQEHYIYRFLSDDTIKGEKVRVIDVIPHMLHEKNRLFGKVWLRASDCSILKIQWNPKYVDSFNRIL